MRFVPYKGTGGVVKDIAGGHLRVGFAQPGKWNKHITSGVACPLALLNETRLDHPLWKDVPTIGELGANFTRIVKEIYHVDMELLLPVAYPVSLGIATQRLGCELSLSITFSPR